LLLFALAWPWANPAGAQPAAPVAVGQKETQGPENGQSKVVVEVFGNADYTDAYWGGMFGEHGSGFGGNAGVRVYPSPKTRCGFGFRVSGFAIEGTDPGFFSEPLTIDGTAWNVFGDLFVHSQTKRAQVFFFVGVGFGEAGHHHGYPSGRPAAQHDEPGLFSGVDIGVGLKVPVTKRLAVGPEFRAILAPDPQWISLSIGVGITYTIPKW
jgi:hypothetical protein